MPLTDVTPPPVVPVQVHSRQSRLAESLSRKVLPSLDGLRAVARKHPGAITAFHQRPVQGPQAARFPETGLESFRAAGFDISEAYSAVKVTALVVLGLLIEEVGHPKGRKAKTDLRALPAERFPQAHELRKMTVKPDVWAYTIDTLVAGLAANLRSQKRAIGGGARR